MVGFLLWDPYFFGYDSKLLGLGINRQVMSFQDMCQLAGAVVASVAISAEAVSAKAVVASVGAVATFIRATVGIFG